MQRQLVLCLLGQSSFSKHLTAVRETNLLLKRAVDIREADHGHSMKVGALNRTHKFQHQPTPASGLLDRSTLQPLCRLCNASPNPASSRPAVQTQIGVRIVAAVVPYVVDAMASQSQVNVDWLRENDIVKQLLRANLHQKQYVDQVCDPACLRSPMPAVSLVS